MLVAMTLLASSASKTSESSRQLPFSPLLFGAMAFSILLGLLALTYAFRSVGKRH